MDEFNVNNDSWISLLELADPGPAIFAVFLQRTWSSQPLDTDIDLVPQAGPGPDDVPIEFPDAASELLDVASSVRGMDRPEPGEEDELSGPADGGHSGEPQECEDGIRGSDDDDRFGWQSYVPGPALDDDLMDPDLEG